LEFHRHGGGVVPRTLLRYRHRRRDGWTRALIPVAAGPDRQKGKEK